jgi:hypothetical protein
MVSQDPLSCPYMPACVAVAKQSSHTAHAPQDKQNRKKAGEVPKVRPQLKEQASQARVSRSSRLRGRGAHFERRRIVEATVLKAGRRSAAWFTCT